MSGTYQSLKEQKDALRALYRERRRALSPEQKALRDAAICNAARSLVSFRHGKCILLYAPAFGEIDILPLVQTALQLGKKVAFPRCNMERRTMEYHFITALSQLSPDTYGIREPDAALPIYQASGDTDPAVCFVPGLVFDRAGYRLGYGKGYYDRFLPAFRGCKIGVAYSDFVVPSLPRGRYDTHTDILLTEKAVRVSHES